MEFVDNALKLTYFEVVIYNFFFFLNYPPPPEISPLPPPDPLPISAPDRRRLSRAPGRFGLGGSGVGGEPATASSPMSAACVSPFIAERSDIREGQAVSVENRLT